jgi:hypothetical protein
VCECEKYKLSPTKIGRVNETKRRLSKRCANNDNLIKDLLQLMTNDGECDLQSNDAIDGCQSVSMILSKSRCVALRFVLFVVSYFCCVILRKLKMFSAKKLLQVLFVTSTRSVLFYSPITFTNQGTYESIDVLINVDRSTHTHIYVDRNVATTSRLAIGEHRTCAVVVVVVVDRFVRNDVAVRQRSTKHRSRTHRRHQNCFIIIDDDDDNIIDNNNNNNNSNNNIGISATIANNRCASGSTGAADAER